MNRLAIISLAVVLGVSVLSNVTFAHWNGYGMTYGASVKVETMKKFQKETLSLRDALATKQLELQSEYYKAAPNTNRIATLRKEIIDLQAKIQTVAEKYGISAWGPMGGMMGYMGQMCPMGW